MSDTPRTVAARQDEQWHSIECWTSSTASKIDMDLIDTENHNQQNQEELKARIKQLEEELMDTKNKHAVLVADVVLNEDRAERIKHLEREVEVLRLYGNKDCTAQADEALKEAK